MAVANWGKQNYEGSGYEVYPAGAYLVKTKKIEETVAKSSGNKQFKVQGEIVEPAEFAGKPITQFMVNLEHTVWKIQQFVYGCGVDVSKLPDMDIHGEAFKKVVMACEGRNSIWAVGVKKNDKGEDVNEIVKPFFQRVEGEDLVEIDLDGDVDVPAWVKE
jgi:hypothetical protein